MVVEMAWPLGVGGARGADRPLPSFFFIVYDPFLSHALSHFSQGPWQGGLQRLLLLLREEHTHTQASKPQGPPKLSRIAALRASMASVLAKRTAIERMNSWWSSLPLPVAVVVARAAAAEAGSPSLTLVVLLNDAL